MLGEIMGPYYHEINKGMLLEQRNEPGPGAASEHKYSLHRKRIIVGSETNKGQKIDGGNVKSLTGEDDINCRPNFRSEITFKPTHSLFLHTNHVPYGLASDFALVQRLLKIEFPFMYVDDIAAESKLNPGKKEQFRQKDPDLKERLRKIKPGILRWMVEGCLEWQEHGLAPPAAVLKGVAKLANEEDYIGQFIEDCLTHEPDNDTSRISCKAAYEAFRWWWAENRDPRKDRIPAMKTINSAIRDRGYLVEKRGGKTWLYQLRINYELATDIEEFIQKAGYKS